jgi:hypothetical protein
MNFLRRLILQKKKKLDDSSCLHIAEIARVALHASFQPMKQEKTCNSAHEQTPLSDNTIDSVLHQEVGQAKDLSAPPRMTFWLGQPERYCTNECMHMCVHVCVCMYMLV